MFFVFMFLVCVALFFITIVCETVSRKMSLEKARLVSEACLTPTLCHTLLAPFVLLLTFYYSSPITPFHLQLNLSRPCSPGTFTQLLADKIQYFLGVSPFSMRASYHAGNLSWWDGRQRKRSYYLGHRIHSLSAFSLSQPGSCSLGSRSDEKETDAGHCAAQF